VFASVAVGTIITGCRRADPYERHYGLLHDLVLNRGDALRALTAIRFG
jgi:hypothetical protein